MISLSKLKVPVESISYDHYSPLIFHKYGKRFGSIRNYNYNESDYTADYAYPAFLDQIIAESIESDIDMTFSYGGSANTSFLVALICYAGGLYRSSEFIEVCIEDIERILEDT